MLNLGYVNRFGSGVNTVSTLLEENKSIPAEFLLGDYTTFKVVVPNADVIENGTDVTDKKPTVIVNITENGTDKSEFGTDNGIDGTVLQPSSTTCLDSTSTNARKQSSSSLKNMT